jgi:hypothetical protein
MSHYQIVDSPGVPLSPTNLFKQVNCISWLFRHTAVEDFVDGDIQIVLLQFSGWLWRWWVWRLGSRSTPASTAPAVPTHRGLLLNAPRWPSESLLFFASLKTLLIPT